MYRTKDQVAQEIIAEGRRQGVSARGIVIGLAVGLVESGLVVYANAKVAGSLALPHDAVGSDGMSVGPLQQQVRQGLTGEWWWGPVDVCQDPTGSARLFFAALRKLAYDSATTDVAAGAIAQAVQKSAYPDRYAARMGDARAIYDRLTADTSTTGGSTMPTSYFDKDRSAEFDFGGPRPVSQIVGICVHTTESGKSATATARTADDVTSYQVRTQTGSYHVMVGVDGTRIRQNTDDWATWSTGNKGNDILLHLCFVGNASQTRAEWLAQDKMLRAGAATVAYWCAKYGIPARKVTAAGLPGILGHVDTRAWGGTDHTDPGVFVWPEFIEMVQAAMTGTPGVAPSPTVNAIDVEAQAAAGWIGKRLHDGERPCKDGVGRFADFEHGSIYWHPDVADGKAIAVPTHIYQPWSELGWEQGFCGYPVRRHTVIGDVGDIQAFQGATIYRRFGQPGYPVRGVIGARWAAEGFETGPLGWPTSDERDNGTGGRVQDFDGGRLEWDPSGAVKVVTA
ncbi:N-acetylmuramoyl-L-alanine amidase [Gordonia sp. (in: high G+C Gram-positive bacteria)]|uniref:N-acetylmuramoyl-L-alanine amidase n=1 Tax=Gordonia sp. (in: high G+C Gram-positive bacteria) TaxID=84139 RepID=UPI00261A5964|nr:N-acetylmuramoyl-L-alanine amidase [Gordonia sp. (in: high G+C Gram-positive bacteria)]